MTVVRGGLVLEIIGVAGASLAARHDSPAWVMALTLGVYGLGLGLAAAQLTSTILADIPASASGQGSATQSTARQLGSALGTAGAGAVLSLTLPAALTARVDEQFYGPLIDATLASAGTNLPDIRATAGEEVARAFIDGFSEATSWVMVASAAALGLALALTLRMRASESARTSTGH